MSGVGASGMRWISRILMSVIFLMGAMKFMNLDGTQAYMKGGMESAGLMPTIEQIAGGFGMETSMVLRGILLTSTVMEVLGGLLLLVGLEHCAVPTLLAYLIPVTFIMHLPKGPDDQANIIQMLKNFVMIGGLIALQTNRPLLNSELKQLEKKEHAE